MRTPRHYKITYLASFIVAAAVVFFLAIGRDKKNNSLPVAVSSVPPTPEPLNSIAVTQQEPLITPGLHIAPQSRDLPNIDLPFCDDSYTGMRIMLAGSTRTLQAQSGPLKAIAVSSAKKAALQQTVVCRIENGNFSDCVDVMINPGDTTNLVVSTENPHGTQKICIENKMSPPSSGTYLPPCDDTFTGAPVMTTGGSALLKSKTSNTIAAVERTQDSLFAKTTLALASGKSVTMRETDENLIASTYLMPSTLTVFDSNTGILEEICIVDGNNPLKEIELPTCITASPGETVDIGNGFSLQSKHQNTIAEVFSGTWGEERAIKIKTEDGQQTAIRTFTTLFGAPQATIRSNTEHPEEVAKVLCMQRP